VRVLFIHVYHLKIEFFLGISEPNRSVPSVSTLPKWALLARVPTPPPFITHSISDAQVDKTTGNDVESHLGGSSGKTSFHASIH
jgi:hypothetical protein